MAGMQQSMLYTMPLMFGMFSLSFPAGLSIYFILSNIIGIGQGYLTKMGPMKAELPTTPAVSTMTDSSDEDEDELATGPASSANGRQGQPAKRKRKRRPSKK